MEMKVTPPEDINKEELEKSFDDIERVVNAQIRRANSPKHFHCDWYQDKNGSYIVIMDYSGEGRIKNFLLKKLIKRAMKKVDKRIEIK